MKRRDKPRGYETEEWVLVIEKVYIPHNLEKDSGEYQLTTLDWRLRVKGGPILFERTYFIGDPEDIDAFQDTLNFKRMRFAENEWLTQAYFYQELHSSLGLY